MKKPKKYFLRALMIILAVFLLLFIAIFAYVSVNRKSIITQVTHEIETKLNGKLSVGSVELSFIRNFPSASVLLHDVVLTDTMFAAHHHAFFKGKDVFISLALTKLIRKQPPLKGIRIDEGSVYLYTDTAGYTNTYLLRGKKDSTKKAVDNTASVFKDLVLNNVTVIIEDQRKGKMHNFMVKNLKAGINDAGKIVSLSTKANILVRSLAFNTSRGSFLKDKVFSGNFDMQFDKALQQLQFDSINIKISGQPFNMTGRFELSGITPQFNLRLHTHNLDYAFAKTLMPAQIARSLSMVDLDKPLDVHAIINGPLKGGDPFVYTTWEAKNSRLITPFLDFDDASFTGFFTNEVVPGVPRKDPNSKIEINHFTANWHTLPIVSNKIEILNLTIPELSCDLSSNFELTKLNELVGSNSLKLENGSGAFHLNYKGPIEKNDNTNSFLNGDITFKDGTILYAPRDVEMKSVNGRLVFRNSDVFVENLQTIVFGQRINMQGQAKNLLTLINTEPDKANIDWNISSPSFNLEPFTILLSQRKKTTVSSHKNKGVAAAATKIDNLLEQGRLHVGLQAGSLHYKHFDANNALADITLLQDRYIINNVSMDHAGGKMNMNGSLITINGNNHQAKLAVNMNNVDVSRVLKAFDNFGQDGITAQNLEGKLTTKVDAAMLIDGKGKVVPSTLAGIVNFSLKDGALNNYEPIKKVQRFVFKNRDFDNIRFAELKNTLVIKDREIKINRMEIQSTVLSMYVEGVYSQKGNTDMSIQVPLSNLKKRSADFNPENLGADKKGGGSIYIRGRPGPDGNVKFKLDLFNKFDKQKDKAKTN